MDTFNDLNLTKKDFMEQVAPWVDSRFKNGKESCEVLLKELNASGFKEYSDELRQMMKRDEYKCPSDKFFKFHTYNDNEPVVEEIFFD
jgi:hypothetical protein